MNIKRIKIIKYTSKKEYKLFGIRVTRSLTIQWIQILEYNYEFSNSKQDTKELTYELNYECNHDKIIQFFKLPGMFFLSVILSLVAEDTISRAWYERKIIFPWIKNILSLLKAELFLVELHTLSWLILSKFLELASRICTKYKM